LRDRIEPDLPSIMPDLDQVKDFKQSQTLNNHKNINAQQSPSNNAPPAKSSAVALWLGIFSFISIATGSYIIYHQNKDFQAKLLASEQRIAELEYALSATGEEMGESAGVIRAKLTSLGERTDELWSQMDKLWASAWRRNQTEIKKLNEQTASALVAQKKLTQTQSNASSKLNAVAQNQTDQAFKLALLEEQLQNVSALNEQLTLMRTELEQLKSKTQISDSKQLEIGSSIAQLEITQNALTDKLERLETKLNSVSATPNTVSATN